MSVNDGEIAEISNNSGQGKETEVPEIVSKKFNWGAFWTTWIWGLCHKTYITLLVIPIAFIPYVGSFIDLGLKIWFGIKGNEWAWQNNRYKNIETFHKYQEKWATISTAIFVGLFVLGILVAILMPGLIKAAHS